jgi:hypothetical protein
MGTTTPLPTREGVALLRLDAGSPVFLEGLTEPFLTERPGVRSLPISPLEITASGAHPGEAVTVHWRALNPFPRQVKARLSFHSSESWPRSEGEQHSVRSLRFVLDPGEARGGTTALPVPPDTAPGSHEITATLRLGKAEVQGSVQVEVMPSVLEV